MKTQLIIIFVLFNLCSSNLHSQTAITVREQLEDLNKYWKQVHLNDKISQEKIQLKTDFELISKHLFLVERYLREKPLQLTEKQYQNRNLCLDILFPFGL